MMVYCFIAVLIFLVVGKDDLSTFFTNNDTTIPVMVTAEITALHYFFIVIVHALKINTLLVFCYTQ